MWGAIIGDIVGSRFERFDEGVDGRMKSKEFEFFHKECRFTDDTVLTVAIAEALMGDRDYAKALKKYARRYPKAGYGASFKRWVAKDETTGYMSFGNGASMRVSPVGWWFDSKNETLDEARRTSIVTHNHPDSVDWAQATALSIFFARHGSSKDVIREEVEKLTRTSLGIDLDAIRPTYKFYVSSADSVPQAIQCFLDSTDFESAIRLAVSLGGDTDTQAAIAGSIAEAFYGIPDEFKLQATTYLRKDLFATTKSFSRGAL